MLTRRVHKAVPGKILPMLQWHWCCVARAHTRNRQNGVSKGILLWFICIYYTQINNDMTIFTVFSFGLSPALGHASQAPNGLYEVSLDRQNLPPDNCKERRTLNFTELPEDTPQFLFLLFRSNRSSIMRSFNETNHISLKASHTHITSMRFN